MHTIQGHRSCNGGSFVRCRKARRFGALIVQDVELEGVLPIVSAFVTAFVRRAIAERLNPFPVLRVSQLSLSLSVQASGGNVKAIVKDVRSEVQEGALKLY